MCDSWIPWLQERPEVNDVFRMDCSRSLPSIQMIGMKYETGKREIERERERRLEFDALAKIESRIGQPYSLEFTSYATISHCQYSHCSIYEEHSSRECCSQPVRKHRSYHGMPPETLVYATPYSLKWTETPTHPLYFVSTHSTIVR